MTTPDPHPPEPATPGPASPGPASATPAAPGPASPGGTWPASAPRDVLGLLTPAPGEPAFDGHRPPPAELVADCVHCGFCLPTCPTYVLWGEEMDSPRGRIHLMRQGLEGEPLTEAMVGHFDACLGCMACVTACPSGVRYDTLIENTRQQVERRHSRTARERALRAAIFALFPYPKRLRLLRGPLRAYQASGLRGLVARTGLLPRLAPTLATLESLAPRLTRASKPPDRVPAYGPRRAVVGMLTGCVQSAFFPGVNAATARVLAAEGCEVVINPARQGCCGALSVHNGREEEAQEFAPDRAAAFAARVRDLSELLVELGPVARRHPLPVSVAYHDACHLGHAQGVRSQPRELLGAIPELELLEIADPELCCGSAGVWNVLNPEPAARLGERKARDVLATGARLLVTANPGCLMQIAAAIPRLGRSATPRAGGVPDSLAPAGGIALAHTAQVLDASIRRLPVGHLLS